MCKHRLLFQIWSEPRTLTENNRRVESQAIRKVRGQKRKSVPRHSQQFTALVSLVWAVTWSSAWCPPPHPCYQEKSPVSDLVRFGRGVTRALLRVQLCFARTLSNCLLLFTSSFFFCFFFFLAVLSLLFVTNLCLPGYRLLSGCDSAVPMAARIILPDHSLSTTAKLKKLDILPLQEQFVYNTAVLMFKVHMGWAPQHLCDLFNRAPARYE